MYIWGLRGPYTTIWVRNRGFFSSEAEGRGRKKSEVEGPYRCIWPEKTPYLQYIYHLMLPDFDFLYDKRIKWTPSPKAFYLYCVQFTCGGERISEKFENIIGIGFIL